MASWYALNKHKSAREIEKQAKMEDYFGVAWCHVSIFGSGEMVPAFAIGYFSIGEEYHYLFLILQMYFGQRKSTCGLHICLEEHTNLVESIENNMYLPLKLNSDCFRRLPKKV